MNPRTERRLSRRMRFRSRSVAVSVVLAVIAVAAAYVGVEAVLAALALPALLLSPADMAAAVEAAGPGNAAAAAGLAVLGLCALIAALTPGGRARRELADDRAVFVIDDEVVAGGISRAAALSAGVPRAQVITSVGRRRATVHVRPSTGFPVDADKATDAAARAVSSVRPRRSLAIRIAIDPKGVLA